MESYLGNVEDIILKKIHLYQQFYKKIGNFRKMLKEEEETHTKVRSTFYY